MRTQQKGEQGRKSARTLLATVLGCNVIIFLIAALLQLERPILLYEHVVLLLLVPSTRFPLVFYGCLVNIVLLDIATISSKLFFQNPTELLYTLNYIEHYSLNIYQLLTAVLLLAIIVISYRYVAPLLKSSDRSWLKKISALIIIGAIVIDFTNGSSVLLKQFQFGRFIKKDVASNNIVPIFFLGLKIINYAQPDSLEELKQESPTFNTFKNDTTGNQLLVLVESFGKIKDEKYFLAFRAALEKEWISSNWKITWGETRFKGSTTAAEFRELLNHNGRPEQLINCSKGHRPISIFDSKKEQGFQTIGVHSYSQKMFARERWWPAIGIEKTVFKEQLLQANPQIIIDQEGPFRAINDEKTFDYLQTQIGPRKTFAYFLTSNAHVPFDPYLSKQKPAMAERIKNCPYPISANAKSQLARVQEILSYLVQKADSNKWNKILVVGDHPPPFLSPGDRNFYSNQIVPYIVLTKK
jgi:hypothetical protein